MISAVCWIPKGVLNVEPTVVEPPTKEEIIKNGALQGRKGCEIDSDEEMDVDTDKKGDEVSHALAAADALRKSSSNFQNITDAFKELDMDHYDEEDADVELFTSGFGNTYYPNNNMDPYLKDKEDEDEEIEDLTIKPSDAVIICAHCEDEVNHLEVYILEETEDDSSNMYVHHDIIIPAFPLCIAWLDCDISRDDKRSFIAVGMDGPSIEIWDLDLIDEVQPCRTLGGIVDRKKKKAKKAVKYKEDSHRGPVLGLSWNKEVRNVLASASADKTVKIWDIVTGKCAITMDHHTDKVQAVAWNGHVPEVLISGSFDHSIVMKDMKCPSHTGVRWSIPADVESLAWNPHSEHSFLVSLEDGTVQGFDIRAASSEPVSSGYKPIFTLHAHDKAVCALSFNTSVANLLATGSNDKMVKLWDLSNDQPTCLAARNTKAGHIFSVSFSEDAPHLLLLEAVRGNCRCGTH